MGIRRKGREYALQLLYQHDLSQEKSMQIPEIDWKELGASPEVQAFALDLFRGVLERLPELDRLIESHSFHWKVSRMASVDRSVLRLALYELLCCPDIPAKVTINEAVEIAKRYGTEESGSFVNGILDGLGKELTLAKFDDAKGDGS